MKKIFLLAASLLSLVACENFLKEESKSQMTQEYYNTPQGLYAGVGALYSSCREVFADNLFLVNIFSDLTEPGASRQTANYDAYDPGNGTFNDLFCDLQQGVMLANRVERVIIGEGEDIHEPADATQKVYLAEIRGLRATFYQYLVELWGRYGHFQPKVFDKYEDAMLEINQVSVADYYKQILTDIDYAIANLPTQSQISEFGRLSQGAAKALKARFLLAIAGYSHPDYQGQPEYNIYNQLGFSSENDLYTEARKLATSVINDYSYKLLSNWEDNFDEDKQVNDEVIWSIQWTQDKAFNDDSGYVHRYGVGKSGNYLSQKYDAASGKTTVTEAVVQVTRLDKAGKTFTYSAPSHSMWYGREYRHVMPTYKWIMMFDNKDKRKEGTFETVYLQLQDAAKAPEDMTDTVCYMPFRYVSPEEDAKYTAWVKSGDTHAYYLDGLNEVYDFDDPDPACFGGPLPHRSRYYNLKKFYDRSRIEKAKQEEGTANVSCIRLSEMYIIQAECAFRLGEGEQAVYNALQPIWARAFDNIADADVYKPAPGTMDINFIIDEYDREVGFEYNTYFILKRTRTLLDRVGALPKSKQDGMLRWRDFVQMYGDALYLRPFPMTQALRIKNMTRDMLPPGYDYGANFN